MSNVDSIRSTMAGREKHGTVTPEGDIIIELMQEIDRLRAACEEALEILSNPENNTIGAQVTLRAALGE